MLWAVLVRAKMIFKKTEFLAEGTREPHPCVQDLQHPRLCKPRRGLQIMDTRSDGIPLSLLQRDDRFY